MVRAHAPRATVAHKASANVQLVVERPGWLGIPSGRFEYCLPTVQDQRLGFPPVRERSIDYKRALHEQYRERQQLSEVIKKLESREGKGNTSDPIQTCPQEHACRGTADSIRADASRRYKKA
jgi:hypothetical protein